MELVVASPDNAGDGPSGCSIECDHIQTRQVDSSGVYERDTERREPFVEVGDGAVAIVLAESADLGRAEFGQLGGKRLSEPEESRKLRATVAEDGELEPPTDWPYRASNLSFGGVR
jgi:hypothetical protein